VTLSWEQIRDLYRKRAGRYDLTANLYYLIGFRERHYRKRAVAALDLQKGDTVVELGCGTGLNFSYLQSMVGPEGKIVGVDLTDAMLARAAQRVDRHGWRNVELVQADAGSFALPDGVRGILSTFALTLMPDYERIIQTGRQALAAGGRLVILDLKESASAPGWVTRFMIWITSPFGVTRDLTARHPWECLELCFPIAFQEEYYFGYVYLAAGGVV